MMSRTMINNTFNKENKMQNLFTVGNMAFNFSYGSTIRKVGKKEISIRTTVCTVTSVLDERIFNMVETAHDSRDNFEKAKGRKASLAAVMSQMGVDREIRTAVWKAYFDKCPYKHSR